MKREQPAAEVLSEPDLPARFSCSMWPVLLGTFYYYYCWILTGWRFFLVRIPPWKLARQLFYTNKDFTQTRRLFCPYARTSGPTWETWKGPGLQVAQFLPPASSCVQHYIFGSNVLRSALPKASTPTEHPKRNTGTAEVRGIPRQTFMNRSGVPTSHQQRENRSSCCGTGLLCMLERRHGTSRLQAVFLNLTMFWLQPLK